MPAQVALALFGAREPLPAADHEQLEVPLLEPSDLPDESQASGWEIHDREGLAAAPAGGDWLEPEPGQWGDAENGDRQTVLLKCLLEKRMDVGMKEKKRLGRRLIAPGGSFSRQGVSVEKNGNAKLLAYGAAVEKEGKDGEEGKKRRALGEVVPSVTMTNLVPIDVEKKGEKRKPSWGAHHLK
ncbi:hypothetical protein BDK51DRAFT_33608 [Blyttiomyces helicus]|uniref:Uncharacterized protein n=1 Tax=Blyttiomyces helicus TaxID=388810 RepID=A0A4P9VUL6_9FUNG|nr:hypothetical protein BDK51DRAFT_33608 [Blyttiomyces helicus]|eukprot:RKO83281.1 hypothetical protein BDK51DRAFT_33608 [Blyttiomyces helicus]